MTFWSWMVKPNLSTSSSTASELQGPRVKLTFRWISQHMKSCPLASFLGCALPSGVYGLAERDSCVRMVEEMKMAMFWSMVLLVVMGACFLCKCVTIGHGEVAAVIAQCLSVCSADFLVREGSGKDDGHHRGGTVRWDMDLFASSRLFDEENPIYWRWLPSSPECRLSSRNRPR